MTFARKARPNPVVTYRPRLMTENIVRTQYEMQALQIICDRDQRIAQLEYALKETLKLLNEQPTEVGQAKRLLQAALSEEKSHESFANALEES